MPWDLLRGQFFLNEGEIDAGDGYRVKRQLDTCMLQGGAIRHTLIMLIILYSPTAYIYIL